MQMQQVLKCPNLKKLKVPVLLVITVMTCGTLLEYHHRKGFSGVKSKNRIRQSISATERFIRTFKYKRRKSHCVLMSHRKFTDNDTKVYEQWSRDNNTSFLLDLPPWNSSQDLLKLKPFQFLPNFRNPCWAEKLDTGDIYRNNSYGIVSSHIRALFDELSDEWTSELEKGSSWRQRCLPYFYILGQPKCGTTDLFAKLSAHPQVLRGAMKEPHWWSRRRFKNVTPYTMDYYLDLFDWAGNQIKKNIDDYGFHPMVTGEASASTLWDNSFWYRQPGNIGLCEPKYITPHYITHFQPQAKFIVILRDPTRRLYSDYLYFVREQKSPEIFHELVVNAINLFYKCLEFASLRACSYDIDLINVMKVRLLIGLYYVYIRDWLQVVSRDQMLIIRLEDYARDPKHSMKRVFDFLELDPLNKEKERILFSLPAKNTRRKKDRELGPMLKGTKLILDEFYRPYNEKLSLLLDDERFLWQPVQSPDTS